MLTLLTLCLTVANSMFDGSKNYGSFYLVRFLFFPREEILFL